ncbi:MAG: hypothetical protein C3F08_02115 [Candidatus Methylomirabilota bacterium]|nr:MAG: hypothetical protein C3F08_02115 [candidate division NC10 bacterium]
MSATRHYRATGRVLFLMLTAVLALLSACGSVQHSVKLDESFTPDSGTPIQVGQVANQTGHTFDVNVEQLLTDALTEKLRDKQLLWPGGDGRRLMLTSTIVEYEEGNAFKRWMLPGWGSTVLTVRGDLKDGERLVGSVDARRTVSFGGAFTIGAWKSIVGNVAEDIVGELHAKLQR